MGEKPPLTGSLIDLGFCTPEDIDEILARQLIFGGDLETVLLESGRIDEPQLLRALARTWGREAVDPGPLPLDVDLSRSLQQVSADLLGGRAGETALVLSKAPLTAEELLDLEGVTQTPLFNRLASGLRLAEARAYLRGEKLPDKLAALVAQTGHKLEDTPPASSRRTAARAPIAARESSPDLGDLEGAEHALRPPPAAHPSASLERAVAAPLKLGSSRPPEETAPPPADYEEVRMSVAPPPPKPSTPSLPAVERPSDLPTYPLSQAEAALAEARDRDRIVQVVLDYCSQFFTYTAVFAVQSSEARGLSSRGPGASPARLDELRVPLDLPSAFAKVKETGVHRVARLRASGVEGGISSDLERPVGRAVLLIPITVRKRVLLLIWGDDGEEDVDIERSSPALSIAPAAARALEKFLIERKRATRAMQPSRAQQEKPKESSPPSSTSAPEAPPPAAAAKPLSATPAAEEQQRTRLGMSLPPARAAESPRDKTQAGMSIPPAGLPRERPSVPPPIDDPAESAQGSAGLSAPPLHEIAAASRRALSDPAGTTSSHPPSHFPSDHPRTIKGFPAQLKLPQTKAAASVPPSPAPRVAEPLLSRRIVPLGEDHPVGEDPAEEEPSGEDQAEGRRLDDDVPSGAVDSKEERPSSSGRRQKPQSTGTLVSRSNLPPEMGKAGAQNIQVTRKLGDSKLSYEDLVVRWLDGDEVALQKLIDGGESAVGALIAIFPGPVTDPADPAKKASECGPLLHALALLGSRATPFVTVRTADEDPDVRRWAVGLLGELPGRESARSIAERLLDESPMVRRAALASARRLQCDALTRRALRSRLEEMTRDPQLTLEERAAAIEAVADIREHLSIPALLTLLGEDGGPIQRATKWALSVLTRRDFADDATAWRTFWQEHRNEPREQWLVSALQQEDSDLKRAAADELSSLLGEPIKQPITEATLDVLKQRVKARSTKS